MSDCSFKLTQMAILYLLVLTYIFYSEWKKRSSLKKVLNECVDRNDDLTKLVLSIKSRDSYYRKIVEISKKDPSIFSSEWIEGITNKDGDVVINDPELCYNSIMKHVVNAFEDGV